MNITIRNATASDADAVCKIYGYYVQNTFVTFTEKNPSVDEYEKSILETQKNFPYLVACDENKKVVAMAYAARIRHHDAYRYSVETTIYVSHETPKHCGIGRALYKHLEQALYKSGYKFMYAVITDDNKQSIKFHKAMGFKKVGHFKEIGFKFGQWKGIVWYRKKIEGDGEKKFIFNNPQ